MHDMLDSFIPPTNVGRITGKTSRVAALARRAIRRFGVTTLVFVDHAGSVFAQPMAYVSERSMEDIVGSYNPAVCEEILIEDLRATIGSRLAAIGMLEEWSEVCRAA